MLELRTDVEFDLRRALDLGATVGESSDIVDYRYIDASGALIVKVAEEPTGTGTRQAGVALRTKCQNLLLAEPALLLIVDFGGVRLVSSSFADEAVGKLFVELGPLDFGQRVRIVGTNDLVKSLIDRAILQRVTQGV